MENYEIYSARTKRRKIKALVNNFLLSLEKDGSSDENPVVNVPAENCNILLTSNSVESANNHLPDVSLGNDADVEQYDSENGEGNVFDNEPLSA